MLLLALPIGFLEIALAKRSQMTALQALSTLTRDADASPKWRLVGWFAVVFVPFFAGSMINTSAHIVTEQLELDLPVQILFAVFAVIALGFIFYTAPIFNWTYNNWSHCCFHWCKCDGHLS